MDKTNNYSIEEHQHRLAAWAASRAASTSKLCRFKVQKGFAILKACGFTADFLVKDLPNLKFIDHTHEHWRKIAIDKAKEVNINGFIHGVAAKLINCYLKVRFICGGQYQNGRVSCLHPPIDSMLLKTLAKRKVGGYEKEWRRLNKIGWSNFSSEEYQDTINLIRSELPDQPLWKIEEYWDGHRGL